MSIKTLKVRVKDKHKKLLSNMAIEVNYVWNYANQASQDHIVKHGKWISGFDINRLTQGSTHYFDYIGNGTIQECGEIYAKRRFQQKKLKLKWRSSFGSNRSLGWIPFKNINVKFHNGGIKFLGKYFSIWDSYGLSKYTFKGGCFSEDSRGRWYFCVSVEVKANRSKGTGSIGVDLGCKETATDSNGCFVKGREYRRLESKLSKAQRAKNKRQVKAIHAKIKNRRADSLHKYSRILVDQNAFIFVGNVSSSNLAKTKMAKSIMDAGWYSLKTMLSYKSEHAGIVYEEINEAYTTVTCSSCLSRSGPSGLKGLRIREWICCECGSSHDRDVNAAKNILRLGHESLSVGAA